RALRVGILLLLVGTGTVLVVEAATGDRSLAMAPVGSFAGVVAFALGLGFGALRSVLGTSGSVLPALVVVFGMDVNVATTATLIVSLPAAAIGALRYARSGYLGERRDWTHVVLPMGLASAVGAVAGVGLANDVAPRLLEIALGSILVGTSLLLLRKRPE